MSQPSPKSSFLAELQRRHVYKVGAMYCVAGWLLVQIATQVFPFFDISNAAVRWVVLAVLAGFPINLVLAWLFDITPQGIVRTPDLAPAVEPPAVRRERRGMERKLNVLLGLLLVAALAYVGAGRLGWLGAKPTDAGAPDKSIAVLPFENLSDDKANAYFAAGIQDEILTRLAGVGDLKVISRTSTEKYASHPDNLKAVAAELGVSTVLEGSVQKAGDAVRVNVQLIDAHADAHLWANTYDRDIKNVFAVESEVSQDIADALKARLSPVEAAALGAAPTTNAAAYDLFLKAEHAANQASDEFDESAYLRAEDFYNQALALDPGFALAHARLAYRELAHHWFFSKPYSAADLEQIGRTVSHALDLAPELPEAHVASGYFHYWGHRDYPAAAVEFRHVLGSQPSNPEALLGLAAIDRRLGDWPQALTDFDKVVAVSPRDSTVISEHALTLAFLRRYAESIVEFKHALAINPGDERAAFYLFRAELLGLGDVDAARQFLTLVPLDTQVLYERLGGDVLSLVGHHAYADIMNRHFDAALQSWNAAAADTAEARSRKLAATVAIQLLAGRAAAARPDCEELARQQEPELAQRPDNQVTLTRLGWAYVCLGRADDALRVAHRAIELLPLSRDAYFGPFYVNGLAQITAQLGRADESLPLIEQLMSLPAGGMISVQRLKLDPVWDPLRGDPRFVRLLARLEAKEGRP